uniref:Uncharacterized protein n=1 Tax=Anguilla anguilla TaxID=7936 RepID=A0A0E9U768_ANGAN
MSMTMLLCSYKRYTRLVCWRIPHQRHFVIKVSATDKDEGPKWESNLLFESRL